MNQYALQWYKKGSWDHKLFKASTDQDAINTAKSFYNKETEKNDGLFDLFLDKYVGGCAYITIWNQFKVK